MNQQTLPFPGDAARRKKKARPAPKQNPGFMINLLAEFGDTLVQLSDRHAGILGTTGTGHDRLNRAYQPAMKAEVVNLLAGITPWVAAAEAFVASPPPNADPYLTAVLALRVVVAAGQVRTAEAVIGGKDAGK